MTEADKRFRVGTVGLILQSISFTVTVPLWLMLHILTSPVSKPFPGSHANSVLLVPRLDLQILPVSVLLGFGVPSMLMALPSPRYVTSYWHQIFIALWQPFPLWTVIIHASLRRLFKAIGSVFSRRGQNETPVPMGTSYLSRVRYVYIFVIGFCMLTQIPVLLLTLLPPSMLKEKSPVLIRLSKITFTAVFVPYFPAPAHQVRSLSEGVLTFLQWDVYIGSTAMLLWTALLYRNAKIERKLSIDWTRNPPTYGELLLGETSTGKIAWKKVLLKIGFWGLLSGPTGAMAVLLWERDAIVRQKIKRGV